MKLSSNCKMKTFCAVFLFYMFFCCDSQTVESPVLPFTEGKVQGAIKDLLDGSLYYSFKGFRYAQALVRKLKLKESPVVTVAEGKVQGAIKSLLDGSPYYSFKGIRYAQAPVGKLRFKAPLPPTPYEGVFDAIEHGPVCPQVDLVTRAAKEGSEDCLRLNVYTKTLEPEDKVPVMVFIHGGAYLSGSGDTHTYGPDFLLQHDVILVTINYRLEVLGFLSLDTPEVPGNAGMKDQSAALRWVKNNIAKFGGDPGNITIFGESAGSASVTYHLLSPLSKGLFQKAIAQSGVCIQDWAIGKDARERAFRVAKNLGKETDSVDELLEFLQSVPAVDLVTQTFQTQSLEEQYRGVPMYFVPVVEKQFNLPDQFLTEEPLQMLLENQVNSVPLMIGFNSGEGILIANNVLKKADFYNNNPSYLLPREIATTISKEKQNELGEKIKQFYFGGAITSESVAPMINMNTDVQFLYNIHRFSDIYTMSSSSVYFYRFDFNTRLNIVKAILRMKEYEGACHADDLFYLFSNPLNIFVYLKDKDKLEKIIFDITKLWADFAKTGKPLPDSSIAKWSPYTRYGKEYFNINESWSPGNYAEKNRVEFWNNLYCEAELPCMAKSKLLP